MSHQQVLDILAPGGMDFAAMGVAFVAYFLLSFLWWGPIFGKKWAVLMGMDPNERQPMGMPMLLQVLSSALLAFVLWHVMMAFAATHSGTGLMRGELSLLTALQGSFWTWLGFFVPMQLGRVAWEKAPWMLFVINAGGQLVALLGMGAAFALMPQ